MSPHPTRLRRRHLALAVVVPSLPSILLLGWALLGGKADLAWAFGDLFAVGGVAVGGISAGVVSIGLVSTGVLSIGVVSFGVVSFGLVSAGTVAIGVWVAGSLVTRPLLTRLWEAKFRLKSYGDDGNRIFLAPLEAALAGREDARLLDLACGTGRMSRLVLGAGWFAGRIDASDGSEEMLAQLRSHLADLPGDVADRVATRCENLNDWPGRPAGSYDAVTLVEASEMIAELPKLLAQVATVLRPGGLLLLTRTPAPFNWFLPGRHQTRQAMDKALSEAGFVVVAYHPWSARYEVVSASKA